MSIKPVNIQHKFYKNIEPRDTIKSGTFDYITIGSQPIPVTIMSTIKFESEVWKLARTLLESKGLRTSYFWGPPGIGKTYGAQRWGLNGRKCYTVTLTEETPAAELRGHFIPKGGEFIWHDGPVTRAMREGARLILNEVAHANCDVLSLLYAVMESPATSAITLPTGEIVTPKQGFQCIITDNISPSGLPAALIDRIDVSLEFSSLSPEALDSMSVAMRPIVIGAAKHKDVSRRISLRSWETIDRLCGGGLELDLVAKAVLGDKWDGVKDSVRVAMASAVSNPPAK